MEFTIEELEYIVVALRKWIREHDALHPEVVRVYAKAISMMKEKERNLSVR